MLLPSSTTTRKCSMSDLICWGHVPRGGYTRNQIRMRLVTRGISAGVQELNMMQLPAFKTAKRSVAIPFALTTFREIGADSPTPWAGMLSCARRRNITECVPEDGPHLRIAYRDQPYRRPCYVLMCPLIDAEGIGRIWCLERSHTDGQLLLTAEPIVTTRLFYPEQELFVPLPIVR
jgi:hypothetical protein